MKYKVLVVDDSNFFQRRLKEIINEHPELEVVGVAANGREAVDMAAALLPDIISMDYEMPVLDGVSAIKEIMAHRPVPILMFSSMTYEGARITLDALAAGAVDFIPKDFAEISRNSQLLKKKLHQRLLEIIKSQRRTTAAPVKEAEAPAPLERPQRAVVSDDSALKRRVSLLVIGASTGGPVALTELLAQLPLTFPLPIMLVQHMPENFTKAFAERLNRLCAIEVKEAQEGDRLRAGTALLAPGGKQMILDQQDRGCIKIIMGDNRINYRPSVDITFASAANVYGDHSLGIVLTGMGSDGCEGARLLKEKGATVWTQDESSCVIYGMPMAVAKANLSDKVLSLKEFAPYLQEVFC